MLTSCKLTGNPSSISAYHSKEENYYFAQASGVEALEERDAARSHVRVHGRLAGILGFREGREISEAAFTNLLSGKDAAGNRVSREHKVMGIDLVFSAPKSVSIAGLLTEKDPRIVEAHDQAVLEVMREIEMEHAAAQPKPGECHHTQNMAYVTARDGYNRDHDPHLHTHVVVMNLTSYRNRVMALDGRQIMARDFNKMWGALYRSKLAARLKELGYSVSYTKKGELRLDAVSLEVEREFSGRRAQIEKAKANGCRDMDAWRKTRKDKDPEIEKSAVRSDWQSRAALHPAKTAEQIRQDTVLARDVWFKEAQWSVEARQELSGERGQSEVARWQAAARRATEHTACASKEAMITEYLAEVGRAETWETMTFWQAEQLLRDQVRTSNILATDDGRYTTWEMARSDRECLKGREARVSLALQAEEVSSRVAEYSRAVQAKGRRELSALQAKAAAGILSAQRAVVVVQGDAGSGKTFMLKAVNDLGQAAGWEIVGVAVQGMAARKLEDESGIKSVTLASYMGQDWAEKRGSRLVVIDEASMLPSRGLAELLRCAEEHGDKVVLVGDRNQIQSIGAGKPFERLVEEAEKAGELLSLSENYRQRDARLREAVDLARQGRMRESLDILDQAGKVDWEPDALQRRQDIAKLYDKGTLVLTGTSKSREKLNEVIRAELIKRGDLASDASRRYKLSWQDEDGVRHRMERDLTVGERVVFLQNEYKDYDVRNGDLGTILKAGKGTLVVRLEDGRELELDLLRYSALDYGYALTTYKSQGQTYDRVIVEADTSTPQLQDQRNTYVQITRARDDARIFTDDKEELRSLAGVLSIKQDTHGIDVSLAHVLHMEQRVRENTLAAQAEVEVRVHNKIYLDEVAHSSMQTKGRTNHMRSVEAMLKERKDLNKGEKHRVAEYLSHDEGARALATYMAMPESLMAAALVCSGTRDLDSATKGMRGHEKDGVEWFVEREEKIQKVNALARSLEEQEKGKEPQARIFNKEYMLQVIGLDIRTQGRLEQMRGVEDTLHLRQDLDEGEKRKVAEYLNGKEGVSILRTYKAFPEFCVALGLAGSGARDFDSATTGLESYEKRSLERFVERQQALESDNGLSRELYRGRNRDFGLSL